MLTSGGRCASHTPDAARQHGATVLSAGSRFFCNLTWAFSRQFMAAHQELSSLCPKACATLLHADRCPLACGSLDSCLFRQDLRSTVLGRTAGDRDVSATTFAAPSRTNQVEASQTAADGMWGSQRTPQPALNSATGCSQAQPARRCKRHDSAHAHGAHEVHKRAQETQ